MNDKPYWYKLLDLFERKGYFWNGLTIPFIIGSRQYIQPTEDLQTISDLIDEINSSEYYVSVLKCGGIGEYVFSLSNEADKNIYGGVDNIVIIDISFKNGVSSNEIIDELELKYSDLINSETYSKTDGEWGDYTDKEINRLQEINAAP
jgi:hypothetical protein